MDVFLVGGGGGAGYAGGGSGYTATQYGIPITTGNNVSVVVGGGGGPASNGGTSSISVNGAVKLQQLEEMVLLIRMEKLPEWGIRRRRKLYRWSKRRKWWF